MTHVVTDACVKCKFTDCVEVCPVNCFYEGKLMLAINPDECIDCGVCVTECPVEAIQPESENLLEWIERNARFPNPPFVYITAHHPPHPSFSRSSSLSNSLTLSSTLPTLCYRVTSPCQSQWLPNLVRNNVTSSPFLPNCPRSVEQ